MPALQSKKVYIFIFIMTLDILIFINYTFEIDINGLHYLRKDVFYLIFETLKGLSTFMIIYFVFRKASKLSIKKAKWMACIKFMFGTSLIINFVGDIYEFREAY